MNLYLVIAPTAHGPERHEFVAHTPILAREQMRRWLDAKRMHATGDIAVFVKEDPREACRQSAARAAAFNEFYRDDVLIL